MTAIESAAAAPDQISEREYKRRVRAWTLYDWANSAFATTILAAVLPVYYSQVAGATLPSEAAATGLWSLGLSISLLLVAILSPILGTISDIKRGKKRFLALFAGMGILATGLLVLVSTGDWVLASILFIFGRIGFTSANVFYDALLPHVAKPEDADRVSTTGYAIGYLGGGLLLAINVLMIAFIPDWFEFAGERLALFSVAIWWAVFSIPLFLRVPEPPGVEHTLAPGQNVVSASFQSLRETFGDIQKYRELFKYLIAFLIYNDGIGTIIGVAAIFGAEMGFGTTELILALLLVQFVGIPFSLVFGRLPSPTEPRRPIFLAFILYNIVMLPLTGAIGLRALPADVTGAPPPAFVSTETAIGEGTYQAGDSAIVYTGEWTQTIIPAEELSGGGFFDFVNRLFGGAVEDTLLASTTEPGAEFSIAFNGQSITLTHSVGPDHGTWEVLMDGEPLLDDVGRPVVVDARSETLRYGVSRTFDAGAPGEHTLTLVNTGDGQPVMTLSGVEVLPAVRQNNLLIILGILFAVEIIGIAFALLLGRRLFSGMAALFDTKRSIILALVVYAIIAIWGFFINSTIEFWLLAWLVATVQGGSQALSRSLYSSMSPAAKSGEFFGLFGVMEKFSAIFGPILFAFAAATFGSSRPAILSLILFFIVGIILLSRVDVEKGRQVAQADDAELLRAG